MIYATYITHDSDARYQLQLFETPTGFKNWRILTGFIQNDYEIDLGGIQWFDDEWHARARFERLVADDITEPQEKGAGK